MPRPRRSAGFTFSPDAIWIILIVAGAIGWITTVNSPPSLAVPVHYLSLLVAIIGVILALTRKWPTHSTPIVIGGIIAGMGLLYWYAGIDSYDVRFYGDDGTLYVDSHYRNGQIYESWIFDKDGTVHHGGMAGSGFGKRHGQWTLSSGGRLYYFFYWYGEEVSEGEWHTRNNRRS